jgi:hypothetical protein
MLRCSKMSSLAPAQETRFVLSSHEQISRAVERVAIRFVRTWGFTTVGMVAASFRLCTPAPAPRTALTRRALAALADLEWLEPTQEWFSLLDHDSAMRAATEKILAISGRVETDELVRALGKRRSFGGAPPAVVQSYVAALSARAARLGRNASVSPVEHAVLEALHEAGGVADLGDLRRATRGALSVVELRRVLQASPLFLRAGRGTYRVVGIRAWPARAMVPSAAWQPTL